MGLFNRKKKVEACIAFVGRSNASPFENDEQFVRVYGGQVRRLVEEKCEGLPYAIWYKGSWTQRCYSQSVIREIADNGFSAYDSGDKKRLFDEITEILILRNGVGMGKMDYSPICLHDQNMFIIFCRVHVREDTLPS